MAGRTGPLANVTIIDCTMALAGPFGTALLADLGADVIKVEPPHGDGARSVPPLPPDYANAAGDEHGGVDYGGYFASINRNKRSVVLDLKREADKEVLLQLCEQADALVENMRVGVMTNWEAVTTRSKAVIPNWCMRRFGGLAIHAPAKAPMPNGRPTTSSHRA